MVNKKIPQRKCMGCNEVKNKKELIRIVRSPVKTEEEHIRGEHIRCGGNTVRGEHIRCGGNTVRGEQKDSAGDTVQEYEISFDRTGKKSGRGAYICPSAECLQKARKTKRIDRVLSVKIADEIYSVLEESIKMNGD